MRIFTILTALVCVFGANADTGTPYDPKSPNNVYQELSKTIHGEFPTTFQPKGKLYVAYNMTVDSGTDLTSADTSTEPAVIYESEPSKFYTLAFVEADDYTFFIRSNGLTRNWLVVNIPGSDISRGNSTATPYLGAKIPECGSTRYVFALAEQPGEIPGLGVSASREKFDMKNYFANNNMTLIGVNFFMTLSNDRNPCTRNGLQSYVNGGKTSLANSVASSIHAGFSLPLAAAFAMAAAGVSSFF